MIYRGLSVSHKDKKFGGFSMRKLYLETLHQTTQINKKSFKLLPGANIMTSIFQLMRRYLLLIFVLNTLIKLRVNYLLKKIKEKDKLFKQ